MLDKWWWSFCVKLVGGPYRPYNQVDREDAALKAQWWNPVPAKMLPSFKASAIAVVLSLFLVGAAGFGLVLIAGMAFYVVRTKKANAVPVDATRLDLLLAAQADAQNRASNQIEVDLGISPVELEDARSNHALVHVGVGNDENPVSPEIFKSITFYTAVVVPRGIGWHVTTFNLLNNQFTHEESELMLWTRVARVVRERNVLVIEASSGSRREFPLEAIKVPTAHSASPESYISTMVNPFVMAAQKYLQGN